MSTLPRLYPLPKQWETPEELIPDFLLEDPTGIGEKAWQIASRLKITEGAMAGHPFGELATEWQRRLIVALWGHRDEAGRRIFKRLVLLTARKSGKTALASILALTETLLNNEARGQVLMLAAQRDQAKLCYNNVSAMIAADEVLARRFKRRDSIARITDNVSSAELKALAAEASGIIGTGPSCAIVDELHMLGNLQQRGMDLVHGIESGMLARAEPLTIFITTAPVHRSEGIYREIMNHARAVFRGEAEDSSLLVLPFEIPSPMDYTDPATWHYANPNLGTTITLESLQDQYRRALARGPEAEAEFLSQNLNIEPDNRESLPDIYISNKALAACADSTISLDTVLMQCEVVSVGIDIGAAFDLSALVVIGEVSARPGNYLLWCHGWLSEGGYTRLENVAPVADFVEEGSLSVVREVGDDLSEIVDMTKRIWEVDRLGAIGADPYGLHEAAIEIEDVTGQEIIGVPQGWRMSPWIDSFERAVLAGKVKHCGNELFLHHFGNAQIVERGEARALTKPEGKKMSPLKMDVVIASNCAWGAKEDILKSAGSIGNRDMQYIM